MKIKARNKFEIEGVRPKELDYIPRAGEIIELSEERGKHLIDMGFADFVVEETEPEAVEPIVEEATVQPKTEVAANIKSIKGKK